jgi:hypothetical protein
MYMGVNDVHQTELYTAEPPVSEPGTFETEMAIEKLKRHKSPVIVQIPADLINAGGRTIQSDIHKLSCSVWNMEDLPDVRKESIIVSVYKKVDKADCSNYRGISLLSTTYKILTSNLLSRLTTYSEEITEDHQCGFQHNRSATDHILCISQILEKTTILTN